MGFKKEIMSIITLGDSDKLEDLNVKYKRMYNLEYKPLTERYQLMINKSKDMKGKNEILVNEIYGIKVKIIEQFKKLDIVCGETRNIKNMRESSETLASSYNLEVMSKVENTISIATPIINGIVGVGAGAGTAAGVWALTSTFGIASTGTPIVLLNGIAASNAVLAAIGGGSLAAGGLGVAGGMSVLGGIVALPVLVFTVYGTNKKVKKEIEKIEKSLEELKEQILILPKEISNLELKNNEFEVFNKHLKETLSSLNYERDKFTIIYEKLYDKIYPIPFFSKFFKMKNVKKGKYYKKYENDISNLLDKADEIVNKFF